MLRVWKKLDLIYLIPFLVKKRRYFSRISKLKMRATFQFGIPETYFQIEEASSPNYRRCRVVVRL